MGGCDDYQHTDLWWFILKFGRIRCDALRQGLLNIRLKLQGLIAGGRNRNIVFVRKILEDDKRVNSWKNVLTIAEQRDGDFICDILHSSVIFHFT